MIQYLLQVSRSKDKEINFSTATTKLLKGIQYCLWTIELLSDEAAIDGIYSPTTEKAIKQFLKINKIEMRESFPCQIGNLFLDAAGVGIHTSHILIPKPGPQYAYIVLPDGRKVSLSSSITPGGHFMWYEFTDHGRNIPQNKDILSNMIRLAYDMERVRQHLGNNPIEVVSQYCIKDDGNYSFFSRHFAPHADAIDFRVPALNYKDVYRELVGSIASKRGLGIDHVNKMVHYDLRPYRARWKYVT